MKLPRNRPKTKAARAPSESPGRRPLNKFGAADRSSGFLSLRRQSETHGGASVVIAIVGQLKQAPVRGYDRTANGQTQPQTMGLCCPEWLERPLKHLL